VNDGGMEARATEQEFIVEIIQWVVQWRRLFSIANEHKTARHMNKKAREVLWGRHRLACGCDVFLIDHCAGRSKCFIRQGEIVRQRVAGADGTSAGASRRRSEQDLPIAR
jgi:hypothetical protein